MKEIFLQNTGTALVPTSSHAEEALQSFSIGAQLHVKVTQKRSLPHHRFFFAFLREVFENWPNKDHGFKPRDEDQMRAWLTVKVGYSERWEWPVADYAHGGLTVSMMNMLLKRFVGNRPIWFKIRSDKIEAAWPKSIAFDQMDENEFKDYSSLVFTLIYAETGMDVEEHYQRWQEKNGKLKVIPVRFKSDFEKGVYATP